MTYRIELAATAKADIRSQALWLRENVSPAAAERWVSGLYKRIDTLQSRPQQCSVAAESDKFRRGRGHGRRPSPVLAQAVRGRDRRRRRRVELLKLIVVGFYRHRPFVFVAASPRR